MPSERDLLRQAYDKIEEELNDTQYPLIEKVLVELSLLFGKLPLPNGIIGQFSISIINRFFQECFGVIGCLRGGAFYASYHHIRDLLETIALFHFVFAKKNENEKLFECFKEFNDVYKYNCLKKYPHYKQKVSPEIFDFLHKKEPYWRKLYGVSSTEKIEKWTKKFHIDDTLDELEIGVKEWLKRQNLEQNKSLDGHFNPYDFNEAYAHYCHYTHFSPLFLEKINERMFGLPNKASVSGLLDQITSVLCAFALVVDGFKVPDINNINESILEILRPILLQNFD